MSSDNMTDEIPQAPEDKLALIRKLLAKAEHDSTGKAEAEAFMARATDLMAKYGVDRAMLSLSDPKSDVVGDRQMTIPGPYAMGRYNLLAAIACALGVRVVRFPGSRGAVPVHLFGMTSQLDLLDLLFHSCLIQCASAMAQDKGSTWDSVGNPKVWARDYIVAFGRTVARRLTAQQQRAAQDNTERTGVSTDLVLVDQKDQVARRVKETYPRLRGEAGRSLTTSGAAQGRAAGERANLGGTGVSGAARRSIG